jgi:hypothetical protein
MELRGNQTDVTKALWHICEISNPSTPPPVVGSNRLTIRGGYPLNTRMNLKFY